MNILSALPTSKPSLRSSSELGAEPACIRGHNEDSIQCAVYDDDYDTSVEVARLWDARVCCDTLLPDRSSLIMDVKRRGIKGSTTKTSASSSDQLDLGVDYWSHRFEAYLDSFAETFIINTAEEEGKLLKSSEYALSFRTTR